MEMNQVTLSGDGILSFRFRFVVEIDVMKSLDHPNIIKLYGTFEDSHAVRCLLPCGVT